MNTRITIALAGLWILLAFQACTKQELITVNEPIELDENSIQYQQYMVERATQLIKEYRFDRLGNTIDRIKDPAAREKVLALLTEYRDRAFNEALYYAKPNGDTIFFFPPGIDSRFEAKRLYISNLYQKAVVNEIGVLHGFKNFPNVETVDIGNSLATGIKDLDGMPELKTFNWTFNAYYFAQFYPEVELAPVPLEFDFSQNNKLEGVNIGYVDMANLKFPATRIKNVHLGSVIINNGEEIDRIAANNLTLIGVSEQSNLVLTAKNIDSLLTDLNLINSLDISATNILTLNTRNSEKIKLNNGLKKLKLDATSLNEKPVFPNSLEVLDIGGYKLSDKNFTAITGLKYFSFSASGFTGLSVPANVEEIVFGVPHPYTAENSAGINQNYSHLTKLKKVTMHNAVFDQTGLVFPSTLEHLHYNGRQLNGTGDYSHISGLKTFAAKETSFEHAPKLPSSLSKLDLFLVNLSSGSVLDISNLNNLDYLRISSVSMQPFTVILPDNLTEDAVKAGYGGINSARGSIILPGGSTIVNAPTWLSQYVHIGNI
ncbi:MAG TPA: hypothetical protein PKA53_07190 [Sphingobacterium sp.]|nr:hypothetical protein [Sphingobacterium sp.]